MDSPTFTQRGNAKRAAEKMLNNGTAPAFDYGIKTRDDGRFEIAWKKAPEELAEPDEVAAEIADAAQQAAPTAHAPIGGESEPDPFPAGSQVQLRARTVGEVSHRIDDGHWAVTVILSAAEFIRPAARQPRTAKPAGEPRRSKATELDEAAASGVMPTKPDVTSHANHHYQKRFDRLAELAAAGDWDGVAGYQCTGVNSYAKMVRQYRDRLVAAHKAQETATAQGAAQ